MNIVAFKKLYEGASPFCKDYENKQLKLEVMIQEMKSSSESERTLLARWIKNTTDYLTNHEEEYNKMKAISSIPTDDINELFESFKAIYGII